MDDESHDDGAPEGLVSREPPSKTSSISAVSSTLAGLGIALSGALDPAPGNETKVFAALATLPDGAARELDAGEMAKFTVVRVADEVLIDLMAKASGISYEETTDHDHVRELDGVKIPFAYPDLLWRVNSRSMRP